MLLLLLFLSPVELFSSQRGWSWTLLLKVLVGRARVILACKTKTGPRAVKVCFVSFLIVLCRCRVWGGARARLRQANRRLLSLRQRGNKALRRISSSSSLQNFIFIYSKLYGFVLIFIDVHLHRFNSLLIFSSSLSVIFSSLHIFIFVISLSVSLFSSSCRSHSGFSLGRELRAPLCLVVRGLRPGGALDRAAALHRMRQRRQSRHPRRQANKTKKKRKNRRIEL